MKLFDPMQIKRQKELSRQLDEEMLSSGLISNEEMQLINGGNGIFRKSELIRKPKKMVDSD